jgi:hypothetical protein
LETLCLEVLGTPETPVLKVMRPTIPTRLGHLNEIGMILDEGLQTLVKLDKQPDVLCAVLLHSVLGFNVAFFYLSPQFEAFMLELTTDPEERSNPRKTIEQQPKLLDRLDKID